MRILLGPARQKLVVLGQFDGHFLCKAKPVNKQFLLLRAQDQSPEITNNCSSNLVARVDDISDHTQEIPKKFPKMLQGLGTMGEPYSIKLKPDAQPLVIYAPCNVPLPFRGKVQEEL